MWFYYFMISVLVFIGISFCRSIIISFTCLASSEKIHNKMVTKILRAPVSFFDSNSSGSILTRFSKDILVTDVFLPQLFTIVLINILKFIVIILFFPMYYIRKKSIIAQNDAIRLEGISKGPINSLYSSIIDGIFSIRIFKKQSFFKQKFLKELDKNASTKFTFNGLRRWMGLRLELLAILVAILSLLSINILISYTSLLNKSIAALSLQFCLEFAFTASTMVRYLGDLENMMTSAQRTMQYAELETEDQLVKQWDPSNFPQSADISFSNVTMKYLPHLPPALNSISFNVKQGQKIGIIGRTGSGKSSIMQTLFRLKEIEEGSRILIDGIDIKTLGLHWLRKNISFIPQTPFLITTTIRDNLDPFNDYSDEQIWNSLQEIHLKRYIEDFGEGLLSEIKSQNMFSAGQKQLLSLARAILMKSKILVMDEATANVDIQTDELIQATIRTKFSNWTILAIAHRLATLKDFDIIITLEDGWIKNIQN